MQGWWLRLRNGTGMRRDQFREPKMVPMSLLHRNHANDRIRAACYFLAFAGFFLAAGALAVLLFPVTALVIVLVADFTADFAAATFFLTAGFFATCFVVFVTASAILSLFMPAAPPTMAPTAAP